MAPAAGKSTDNDLPRPSIVADAATSGIILVGPANPHPRETTARARTLPITARTMITSSSNSAGQKTSAKMRIFLLHGQAPVRFLAWQPGVRG